MDETKKKTFKHIVKGCALALCVIFFTTPLVKCSADSRINVSGWELATGSGILKEMGEKSGKSSTSPLVFLLLVAPIGLLALAFTNKSFAILRNISIAGLVAKITFLIIVHSQLNDFKGAFVLTEFNWIILAIYIGLIGFMQYCIIQDKPVES